MKKTKNRCSKHDVLHPTKFPITLNKKIFHKINPQFRIAFIKIENIDNKTYNKEAKHLLHETIQLTKLTFHKNSYKNHQLILPWKIAQQEFGPNAVHYQTSLEKLLLKVLHNKKVPQDNTITTLTNYLSLKYLLPFGIDDLSKINKNISFAIADGKERINFFTSLKPGTLYYKDNKNILGTKLDFWKNKKTQPHKKTTSALIHLEALPPITNKQLNKIIIETNSLLKTFCSAKTKIITLHKNRPHTII